MAAETMVRQTDAAEFAGESVCDAGDIYGIGCEAGYATINRRRAYLIRQSASQQCLPVQDYPETLRLLLGLERGVDEKAFSIGGDVIAVSQPCPRQRRFKELFGGTELEGFPIRIDLHGHQFVAGNVEELFAVGAPIWLLAAADGNLPFPSGARKRAVKAANVDLRCSGLA